MGAYCRSIVSCLAVFLAMALWAASGQATQEKTPATEETQPIRSFDIEGGSIKLGGGVLASTGFKARLMPLAGKGSIKTELLVLVMNRTPNTVWVEVECQLPEMRQSLKKFKKVKKGKSEGFKWGLKAEEIIWDAEYPFTVSVFADKKQKKALGSETSSFLFNDQSRTELDDARAVLVKEAKVGGRGRLLISGWPEESEKEKITLKNGETYEIETVRGLPTRFQSDQIKVRLLGVTALFIPDKMDAPPFVWTLVAELKTKDQFTVTVNTPLDKTATTTLEASGPGVVRLRFFPQADYPVIWEGIDQPGVHFFPFHFVFNGKETQQRFEFTQWAQMDDRTWKEASEHIEKVKQMMRKKQ